MIRFSRVLAASLVVTAGLVFGEAAIRPTQEAQADSWQYRISPEQVSCEGCCSGGTVLCCSAAYKCRIEPM